MFQSLTTRRLGTRGQSRYHYYGLAVKPESIYYTPNYSSRKSVRSPGYVIQWFMTLMTVILSFLKGLVMLNLEDIHREMRPHMPNGNRFQNWSFLQRLTRACTNINILLAITMVTITNRIPAVAIISILILITCTSKAKKVMELLTIPLDRRVLEPEVFRTWQTQEKATSNLLGNVLLLRYDLRYKNGFLK